MHHDAPRPKLSIDALILTPAEQEALDRLREAHEGMLAADEQLARIDALLADLEASK